MNVRHCCHRSNPIKLGKMCRPWSKPPAQCWLADDKLEPFLGIVQDSLALDPGRRCRRQFHATLWVMGDEDTVHVLGRRKYPRHNHRVVEAYEPGGALKT